ncbi:hypothetical protein HY604_05500 [Candidatus Peregrinibacteria bacterium]|nr:hypothetical protein [Candidatus Peregrinibacteria bacterium]
MLRDQLCQIGFTESEAMVYLALLRLGPQPASIIAKRTSINRSIAYSVLDTLASKGVVSSYLKSGVLTFVASDPNALVGYVDRKCKAFDYHRAQLLSMIPRFRAIIESDEHKKPVVSYYDGVEGAKAVLYDALNSTEFLGYLCMHKWIGLGLADFLLEYKNFRISNRKIPLRAIVFDTPEVRKFFDENYEKDCDFTKILYVKDERHLDLFEKEFAIYDGKIATLSLDNGAEYGIIIENQAVYEMQKRIFDMAWYYFEGL